MFHIHFAVFQIFKPLISPLLFISVHYRLNFFIIPFTKFSNLNWSFSHFRTQIYFNMSQRITWNRDAIRMNLMNKSAIRLMTGLIRIKKIRWSDSHGWVIRLIGLIRLYTDWSDFVRIDRIVLRIDRIDQIKKNFFFYTMLIFFLLIHELFSKIIL